MRFFASGFSHESSSPKPLKTTLGLCRIFSLLGDISQSKCTTAGFNDTGGKFSVEDFFHLPPVPLPLVVHLELRISPRFSKKFETALMGYSRAWGN
jgi:hypothetical protein